MADDAPTTAYHPIDRQLCPFTGREDKGRSSGGKEGAEEEEAQVTEAQRRVTKDCS